jgi:hypothetical protein
MSWDEINTALVEIDEAFEAGELGLSRDEKQHLDRIAYFAGFEEDWAPSRDDILLLEDLLARSVPSLGRMHARLPV